MSANRRYYTIAEYCRLTGAKPGTARKRCQRGKLRCRKTGARWRIWAGNVRRPEHAGR